MSIETRTEELARGVVEGLDLELVHVEFVGRSPKSTLRVFIDSQDGVTLDDCQRVSKQLSVLLEVEDFIKGAFVLEVSSPGIERPLFKIDDYKRFRGREVRITTTEKIDERRKFKGLLQAVEGDEVVLDCEDGKHRLPFAEIRRANLVFDFG